MSSFRHKAEGRGQRGFKSQLARRRDETRVNTNMKIFESYGPHLRWATNGGLTPDANFWKRNQRTSTFELQYKTRKKIQGLFLLSFYSWHISLCRANVGDSVFIRCFFLSMITLKVLWWINFCVSGLWQNFVFINFSTAWLQQGPITTLDVAIQTLTRLHVVV